MQLQFFSLPSDLLLAALITFGFFVHASIILPGKKFSWDGSLDGLRSMGANPTMSIVCYSCSETLVPNCNIHALSIPLKKMLLTFMERDRSRDGQKLAHNTKFVMNWDTSVVCKSQYISHRLSMNHHVFHRVAHGPNMQAPMNQLSRQQESFNWLL